MRRANPAITAGTCSRGTHCFDPQQPNEAPDTCAQVGANGEPLQLPVIEYPPPRQPRRQSGRGRVGHRWLRLPRGGSAGGCKVATSSATGATTLPNPKANCSWRACRTRQGALWSLEQVAQLDAYVLGFG